MTQSPVVSVRHLQDAELQVRRQPHALEILRGQEPELADYVCERLVELDRALDDLCAPRENTRILFRRFEFVLLTCIDAQREAHLSQVAAARVTSSAEKNQATAPCPLRIYAEFMALTCSSALSPV